MLPRDVHEKCWEQQNFDSDPKEACHYNHVTFTPIAKKFMLYCRLTYMLSMLYVRLTIKVKVGIPESFKVGWYPQKITGSSHLKVPYFPVRSSRTNPTGGHTDRDQLEDDSNLKPITNWLPVTEERSISMILRKNSGLRHTLCVQIEVSTMHLHVRQSFPWVQNPRAGSHKRLKRKR